MLLVSTPALLYNTKTKPNTMLKITKPEGMELPAEYQEGDTFTALAEVKVSGGTLEIMSIEGSPIGEEIEETETETEDVKEDVPVSPGEPGSTVKNFVKGAIAKYKEKE